MSFFISCVYIYLWEKKDLFLQENNKGIFLKIRQKINE